MSMVDEAKDLGPVPSIADLAVDEAVDHVVRIIERLDPADRDQTLERLAAALRVMRGPKYLPLQLARSHRKQRR